MIEKNVNELDSLNKEVVQQIPELPSHGRVRVKARISQTGDKRRINIFQREILLPHGKEPATTSQAGVNESTGNESTPAAQADVNEEPEFEEGKTTRSYTPSPTTQNQRTVVVPKQTGRIQETEEQEISFTNQQHMVSPD